MAPPRLHERPLDQLTRLLREARAADVDFETAWDLALRPGRSIVMTNWKNPPPTAIQWPTDRTDRLAWMQAIAATKEGWRRAFHRMPVSEAEQGLLVLADGLSRLDEMALRRAAREAGGIPDGGRVLSAA